MTISTPYTNEHRYDIQDMIDLYGADNLIVDELLVFLALPLSISLYSRDCGNVSAEQNAKDWVTRVLNIYNKNESTIEGEHLGIVGTIEPKDLRT